MIRAGSYDKRVRVERPSAAKGHYGHRAQGWELVAEGWASIRPAGSNERLAAFQMQSGQTHVVAMPYQAALEAVRGDCRIVYGARVLRVVGMPRNPREANEEIVMDCTEGNEHGQ